MKAKCTVCDKHKIVHRHKGTNYKLCSYCRESNNIKSNTHQDKLRLKKVKPLINAINKTYFNNKLKIKEVYFHNKMKKINLRGCYDSKKKRIIIQSGLTRKQMVLTLLHELLHGYQCQILKQKRPRHTIRFYKDLNKLLEFCIEGKHKTLRKC